MPLIRSKSADVYCEERGAGEPLLLIAGLGCDMLFWGGMVDALAERFRVIVFDNRGAGRSPTPSAAYSADDMVDDCQAVMDRLGVESAHVLGHSMGGYLAQRLAARYPHRVRKLVLCSTCADLPSPILHFTSGLVHLRRAYPQTTVETLFRLFMPWLFSARFLSDEARVRVLVGLACAHPYPQTAEGFAYQVKICQESNGAADLPRIQAPTLVLAGSADITIPCQYSRRLADGIARARFVLVEEGGHNLHVEEPARFLEEVRGFLES